MKAIPVLLLLNSKREILSGKLAATLPEVGILSCRLAGAFPEVEISSCRLAGAFPTCEITLCRLANIIRRGAITLCRLVNIIRRGANTLCRLANIIRRGEFASCRTGRLNRTSKEIANNRPRKRDDGRTGLNNNIDHKFFIIPKENGIRVLVSRNRNRLGGFYNNFIINQNF